jgi:hypothetical protein
MPEADWKPRYRLPHQHSLGLSSFLGLQLTISSPISVLNVMPHKPQHDLYLDTFVSSDVQRYCTVQF